MTKIDIFSGFLGAGKTTLIKKMIEQAYTGEKLVLIENEFGEIGIDGGFLAEAGIQINEMNSGCICCSLVGDFGKALTQVLEQYAPDRILIEPSGVGKLSDVIRAVQNLHVEGAELNAFTTVVDAGKCKMYMKNFGEFFNDQVANAGCIVLSHTGTASEKKITECVAMLREQNATATIVTTDWAVLSAEQLLEAMERKDTLEAELARLAHAHHEHEHHHHHDHDEHCECGCHDHEHEHDHEHHHHHHHHADEVFESIGTETTKKFTIEEIKEKLEALNDEEKYGKILRAKGIVACECGKFIYFDFVPGEADVRTGEPDVIGKLCVIGSKINKSAVSELFGVKLKA